MLSQDEVTRLIEMTRNRMHRTILMVLYATGLRRTEASRLKVSDIDSQRMVIHVERGKGLRDRDVSLTPKLLEALRDYWRWNKPRRYLFPSKVGTVERRSRTRPCGTSVKPRPHAQVSNTIPLSPHVTFRLLDLAPEDGDRGAREGDGVAGLEVDC